MIETVMQIIPYAGFPAELSAVARSVRGSV